jgi:hypothetical protein
MRDRRVPDHAVSLELSELAPPRAQRTAATTLRVPLFASIVLALILASALTFARTQTVWSTGAFFDSDDAMRAVQVRDLLAGQGWFDMNAQRVDPPGGLFMHWSRIVDAPLAALESLFRAFLSQESAERATRLVFPLALLAALLRLCAWNASILGGAGVRHAAVWLAFLSGPMFLQFTPGRIDHHAPQIVALVATLGFYFRGLDPEKPRAMAWVAVCMALSIGISLENLPFFVVLLAALPLWFIVAGAPARAALAWFALGAFVAFPGFYAATVAPTRYALSACDAFSSVHVAAILLGALSLAALAAASPRLADWRRRAAASGAAALVILGAVVAMAPRCMGDPLGGLDPLLRDLWLNHVVEAKPLLSFWADSPNLVITLALPVLLGLVAALGLALAQSGLARRRMLVLASAIAAGLAGGLWQVRVLSSVTPLAMVALSLANVALVQRYGAGVAPALRSAVIGLFCVALSPMGFALALPAGDRLSDGPDFSCLAPQTLERLGALAPARIAGPVDLGAHLTAHTPHSVFAAPYHRDNHGNRIAVDALLAPPDEAEAILRKAGAELVVWCASKKLAAPYLAHAPNGLAAALDKGDAPAWLTRLAQSTDALRVYAIKPR